MSITTAEVFGVATRLKRRELQIQNVLVTVPETCCGICTRLLACIQPFPATVRDPIVGRLAPRRRR
jgi:hypothetical protein